MVNRHWPQPKDCEENEQKVGRERFQLKKAILSKSAIKSSSKVTQISSLNPPFEKNQSGTHQEEREMQSKDQDFKQKREEVSERRDSRISETEKSNKKWNEGDLFCQTTQGQLHGSVGNWSSNNFCFFRISPQK
jgi:hypothetical protein